MEPENLSPDLCKRMRGAIGLESDRQLAAKIGINHNEVSRWNNGHKDIGIRARKKLCVFFNDLIKVRGQLDPKKEQFVILTFEDKE